MSDLGKLLNFYKAQFLHVENGQQLYNNTTPSCPEDYRHNLLCLVSAGLGHCYYSFQLRYLLVFQLCSATETDTFLSLLYVPCLLMVLDCSAYVSFESFKHTRSSQHIEMELSPSSPSLTSSIVECFHILDSINT